MKPETLQMVMNFAQTSAVFTPIQTILKATGCGLVGAVSYDGALYLYDMVTSLKLAYQLSIVQHQVIDQFNVMTKIAEEIYRVTECTPVYQNGQDILIELLDQSKELSIKQAVEQEKLDLLSAQRDAIIRKQSHLDVITKPEHYKLMKKVLVYGTVGGAVVGGLYVLGNLAYKLGSFLLN